VGGEAGVGDVPARRRCRPRGDRLAGARLDPSLPDAGSEVGGIAIDAGDYIIYVDESGDHSLGSVDPNFPVFVLAFCIFKIEDYVSAAVPSMQRFKFRWFGHDSFVLHEADIVKKRGPFGFLQFDNLRTRFMDDLGEVLASMPMVVTAAVIRKDRLKGKYYDPDNPYPLALLFCLERAHKFLKDRGSHGGRCYVVCESRSPKTAGTGKEDGALELEFRRIVAGKHYLQSGLETMPCFDIVFASKQANSTGLQIADLIARPIGLRVFRGNQANKAFEIIRTKVWAGGLKVFP
jgi:hypothetical protein